jgi:tetraacyldisaccharide 4'-kinase
MQAPEFWRRRGALSTLLTPVAALYAAAGRMRRERTRTAKGEVPTICVGNLVAGGAGKTPLVLDLTARLQRHGRAVHCLTRGYRGRLTGPVRVDPARHDHRDVGDEALLLAEAAPSWVARDRRAGVAAAAAAGAEIVVLDDGLQNPALAYDLALVAVDGGYGFGNGLVIPAGPLREPVAEGLGRAQAVVIAGEDQTGVEATIARRLPVLRARLVPQGDIARWAGRRVVAFAGIGRPGKFFRSLEELGSEIVARYEFPDHHPYAEGEVALLLGRAANERAEPVTTLKDWVRLPPEIRANVSVLRVALAWEDEAGIEALLAPFVT